MPSAVIVERDCNHVRRNITSEIQSGGTARPGLPSTAGVVQPQRFPLMAELLTAPAGMIIPAGREPRVGRLSPMEKRESFTVHCGTPSCARGFGPRVQYRLGVLSSITCCCMGRRAAAR